MSGRGNGPTSPPARSARFVTGLWFSTAVFSAAALGIRYFRSGEIAWYLAAAAAFTFAMGLATLRRARAGGA